MKILSKLILLTIACFSLTVATATAQEKVELKILSYNLRFGELASLEDLAKFMNEQDADLIALQEVDVLTKRERAEHQNGKHFISELAYRTNKFSSYGKTIPYRGGYYGIGVLSKYPIIKSERILLPMPKGAKEQRAYLVNTIELPNGKHIEFVSTHLEYTNVNGVREIQAAAMNKDLLKRKLPIIVCGDFNAKPDSKEIKDGMSKWLQVSTDDFTIPAKKATSKIDYIFCYPKTVWNVVNAETPVVQLSDHLPVMATVELEFKK